MDIGIDMGMQHGRRHAACTGTFSMDLKMHGHGHSAWTWTSNMSMFMLQIHVHAACPCHAVCPCPCRMLKGTVAWDFLPLVLFVNRTHLAPDSYPKILYFQIRFRIRWYMYSKLDWPLFITAATQNKILSYGSFETWTALVLGSKFPPWVISCLIVPLRAKRASQSLKIWLATISNT
jgi:hypothetical protein